MSSLLKCFVKYITWNILSENRELHNRLPTAILVSLLFELGTKYEVIIIFVVRFINVILTYTRLLLQHHVFVQTKPLTFMIGACKHTIIEQTLKISIHFDRSQCLN